MNLPISLSSLATKKKYSPPKIMHSIAD